MKECKNVSSNPIIADPKAKLKRDMNWYRIEFIMNLMVKYRTSDVNFIKTKILMNPDEWNQYRDVVCAPSYDVVIKKASELYRTTICHRTVNQIFTEETYKTMLQEFDEKCEPLDESDLILKK